MFNFKWAAFPAGAAFVLALLVSLLLGQVGFGLAVARALIFAAVFFGIGCGSWALIHTHLPELLLFEHRDEEEDGVFPEDFSGEGQSGRNRGANVDITLDDRGDETLSAALPGSNYGIEGIGSISELVSDNGGRTQQRDVDQTNENDYTSLSGGFAFAPTSGGGGSYLEDESSQGNGSLGDFSAFFDGLPTGKNGAVGSDDSMSDLFESLASAGPSSRSEDIAPVERKTAMGKPAEMSGDYSPKELAMVVRTALASEKRG